jgi:hypothetical protein
MEPHMTAPAPVITYVEFDENQSDGRPITKLTYAEWKPRDAADKGYGSHDGDFGVHGDGSLIPDEIRLALAALILPEGYTIAKGGKLATFVAALKTARDVVADELQTRRDGGIEDSEDYVKRPAAALEAINAALKVAEG